MSASAEEAAPTLAPWPKRVALGALLLLVGINIWTGGPLLALWLGARVQSGSGGSLTIRPATAMVVFVSLIVITWLLAKLLAMVAGAYDRAAGIDASRRRRQHDRWVRSERPPGPKDRPASTMLERSLVAVVVLAALAFEVWFFFYSTSPIDGRSGRSAAPLARHGSDQCAAGTCSRLS